MRRLHGNSYGTALPTSAVRTTPARPPWPIGSPAPWPWIASALVVSLLLVSALAFAGEHAVGEPPRQPHSVAERLAQGLQADSASSTAAQLRLPDLDLPQRGETSLTCATPPRLESSLWGTDGHVNAIAHSGHTVYIGGTFTTVAPSTGGGVLLDASSGRMLPRFPKVNGPVYVAIPDGHGGWFIGGFFTHVGGLLRQCLAHILADGSVSPWQVEADPFVYALALKGDTLFVGGRFAYLAGQPRNCLGAVNARTGAVLSWTPDPNDEVFALTVQDNTLYVGGNFYDIGGRHQPYLVAVDAGNGALTDWNPNPNGFVTSIVTSDNTVYAGGSFAQVGGQNQRFIAAIDRGTGGLRAWDPNPDAPVYQLMLQGRSLFALGYFTTVGGEPRNELAAIDAMTGALLPWKADTSFARISAFAIQGGSVYVGGSLAQTGIRGVGALDLATGRSRGWIEPTNDVVDVLATDRGSVYVGGEFSTLGAGVPRTNLAALDAETGEPQRWNPNPNGTGINSIAVDGRSVYVGGDFTQIGGRSRSNFASLDARDGRATGPDLSTDGSVEVLATHERTLYVGGGFTRFGQRQRSNLGAVDLGSESITPWNPSVNGPVVALASNANTLFIAGSFDHVGAGTSLAPRNNVAAVDASSGAVLPWNPNANAEVSALALSANTLYVGGRFASIGGQQRDAVAAVDATTGLALPWDPHPGWLGGHVVPQHGIAVAESIVYLGGHFMGAGGTFGYGFAALDANDAQATCWNPGRCFTVFTIVPDGNTVYLGGQFGQIGGMPANNLFAFTVQGRGTGRRAVAVDNAELTAQPARPPFSVSSPTRGIGQARFSLSEASAVTIRVFDLQGRLVTAVLDRAWLPSGEHVVAVPSEGWQSGLYLCRMEVGSVAETRKLVVVK